MGKSPLAVPTAAAADQDLITIEAVCQFWGGNAPLNPATIYRQMAAGQHPRPIKVGTLSRWVRSELLAEQTRRMARRDVPAGRAA